MYMGAMCLRCFLVTAAVIASAGSPAQPRLWVQGNFKRVDWLPSTRILKLPFRIETYGSHWADCDSWTLQVEVPQIHAAQQPQVNFSTPCEICVLEDAGSTAMCVWPIYHVIPGLHYRFELSLLDATEHPVSYAETVLWLRSMRAPEPWDVPSCWQMDEPLGMQDEDCLWLWGALRATSSVHMSIQEVGQRGRHSGSWGPLLGAAWQEPELRECLPGDSFAAARLASCAVVGNAWYLANSSFGAEIDAHEAVIRLNRAPVEGFEGDVGARTTHRLVNSGVEVEQLLRDGFDDALLLFRLAADADAERLLAACRYARSGVLGLSPAFLERVHTEFLRVLYDTLSFRATTGAVAVVWALHHCERITTYGFGGGVRLLEAATDAQGRLVPEGPAGWPRQLAAQYSYYAQKTVTEGEVESKMFAGVHAWDDEALLLNRLQRLGAVQRRFPPGLEHLACRLLSAADNSGAYSPAADPRREGCNEPLP